MTTAYWAQFSKQELDSMHGIEPEDYDDEDGDFEQDRDDEDMDEDQQGCSCGNVCMDCLGMSWRDFM